MPNEGGRMTISVEYNQAETAIQHILLFPNIFWKDPIGLVRRYHLLKAIRARFVVLEVTQMNAIPAEAAHIQSGYGHPSRLKWATILIGRNKHVAKSVTARLTTRR